MLSKNVYTKGVTSVEMVVGVSIAGLILLFSMYTIHNLINTTRDITLKTNALYLAEDGLELLRFVRDNYSGYRCCRFCSPSTSHICFGYFAGCRMCRNHIQQRH